MPLDAYFGRGRSEQIRGRLQSVAAEVGLVMEQRDVIINSRRALGAAEFARQHGRFAEMHLALLKGHWEGTERLENIDDLVKIGAGVGLDADELRKSIEDDRYASVIDQNRLEAESVGINAIPAHIFGRRYLVLGAQPYEAFKEVLERLHEERVAE
jgi:predicted DsbA family dithiol-disulfide isomerase